jgi:SAM-dependent methyltransferase
MRLVLARGRPREAQSSAGGFGGSPRDGVGRVKPFADHFSRIATHYAGCRPGYPEELFAYLGRHVATHDLAWDCAAGSGQATLPLTRIFKRVLATDLSAAMLESAPRHPRIEYRVAPAETSGLAGATADLVTVAQALHWLDLQPFFIEADRVLKPGGVLAVWTYGNQVLQDEVLNEVLSRFYREVVGPYWPPERCHVETGYRQLPFPYAELTPPSFDMEEEWTLPELLGYVGTWSATQRFREARGEDPLPRLARELEDRWGDPASRRTIRWPLSLRAGRRPG